MKILPVGAEMFCGQTVTKLIVAFLNLSDAHENGNAYSLPAFTCEYAVIMYVCYDETVAGPCKACRLQSTCVSAFVIHQLPVTLESAICTGNIATVIIICTCTYFRQTLISTVWEIIA
jgi:hypothetical protein